MNSKFERYTLSTLQKNTVRAMIEQINPDTLHCFGNCQAEATVIVNDCMNKFPAVFPSESESALNAFTYSSVSRYAMEKGKVTIIDYIAFIAVCKREGYKMDNDKGAFGDLLEILVRCALVCKFAFVRPSMLYVKDAMHNDIVSKRFGVIECGHNGKTWTQATVFDFMAGNFDTVIYGMFDDIDKEQIYKLCEQSDIDGAIDYVKNYVCVWTDKKQFQSDIDGLTTGKGLTIKAGKVMTQYNAGKYNAFQQAIENGLFITLSDVLKK